MMTTFVSFPYSCFLYVPPGFSWSLVDWSVKMVMAQLHKVATSLFELYNDDFC
jgi:hypothetical protein